MRVVSNRTLAYWKGRRATLRECLKHSLNSRQHCRLLLAWAYAIDKVRQIEGKVLVCVLLLIMAGGCQAFAGASRDAEWTFGKLGDMAEKAKLEDK